jgi:(2Fe-2S) ferredoxin
MPSYHRHVFICVHERAAEDPKGSCALRGGGEVRDRFKAELKNHRILKTIRPNNAGCLDQCAHGVTIVVYPEQVWYGNVTVDDVAELVEVHLIGGRIVERLLLPDQAHLDGHDTPPEPRAGSRS